MYTTTSHPTSLPRFSNRFADNSNHAYQQDFRSGGRYHNHWEGVSQPRFNKRKNNRNHNHKETKSWPLPFPRPDPEVESAAPAATYNRNRFHNKERDIPHGDNNMPVCLDYLKGVCAQKRWKCKYAHPPLWLVPKGPASERHVCTVFVLTGFCKYGDRCFGLHPPLNDPVCKPAYLSKEVSPYHEDEDEWGSERCYGDADTASEGTRTATPPPTRPTYLPVNLETQRSPATQIHSGFHTVIGLLNRLTPQRFDCTLKEIFLLMASSNDVSLQQVLPLIFGKAVREPLLCSLYAQLCKHLHDVVPKEQQGAVFNQLTELSTTILAKDFGNETDEELQRTKQTLVGTAHFVGQLYLVGLFSKGQMVTKVEHLIKQANNSEVAFELVCTLLNTIGSKLDYEDTRNVDRFMHLLETHKSDHPMRSQCLLQNVQEARGRGWEQEGGSRRSSQCSEA